MKKISSAPLATSLQDDKGVTSSPWLNWFRDISSVLESITKSNKKSDNLVTVQIGKICFIHYEATHDDSTTIDFGLKSSFDRPINVYVDGTLNRLDISKGKSSIKVYGTGNIKIDDWFIVDVE